MALSNIALQDALTRHQICVEGVKLSFAAALAGVVEKCFANSIPFILATGVDNFSKLTKVQLFALQRQIANVQTPMWRAWMDQTLAQMQSFLATDVRITKILMATMSVRTDEDIEPLSEDEANVIVADAKNSDDSNSLWPLAWLIDRSKLIQLWYVINNAPIPANGVLLADFMQAYTDIAVTALQTAVAKGYANRQSVIEFLAEAPAIKARLTNQGRAVTDTVLQHVTSIATAAVSSHFLAAYIWISVLDSRTTPICRDRDGHVYVFGAGPLPPAHINCRSKTAPFVAGSPTTPHISYYDWISRQPPSVQNDILGEAKADRLRAGRLRAADLPTFSDPKALTVAEFGDQLNFMLTRR